MKNKISGYTKLAGVIANPIKHSLSPSIHNKAYELTHTDAVYLAFEVDQATFNQAIQSVKALGMLGVNISMPYKKQAYQACDEVSPSAELIGVVNTVILKNNRLIGHNTDGLGFTASLRESNIEIENKIISILGAGGAARAVICQSAIEKAQEIHVFKRKNETFEEVRTELKVVEKQTGVNIEIHDYHDQTNRNKILKRSDIIVNGTQVGMGENQELPIEDLSSIDESKVVVDLIYHPLETEFLKQSKTRGAVSFNGLGMLIHQAAIAFELMTTKKMPTKKIEEFLITELNRKEEK